MLSLPQDIIVLIIDNDIKLFVLIYRINKFSYNFCKQLNNLWEKLYHTFEPQKLKFNEKYYENVYNKYFENQEKTKQSYYKKYKDLTRIYCVIIT